MSERRLAGFAERASPACAETVDVSVSDFCAGQEVDASMIKSGPGQALPGEARRGGERARASGERAGERADGRSNDRDAQQKDRNEHAGWMPNPTHFLKLFLRPLFGRRRCR